MSYRSRIYYDNRFYTKQDLQTPYSAVVDWTNVSKVGSKIYHLEDVDTYTSSEAGYYARVKSDGSGIEWVQLNNDPGSINHNELNGLQGGTTNEYYHLTQAEYNTLTNANSSVDDASSLHNHDSLYLKLTGGTITGNLTVTGDLTVQGTTTTIDSQNLTIEDNIILLNKGETGNGVSLNVAGIEIDRGTANDNAQLLFDESADKWKVGFATSATYEFLATETWVQNNFASGTHTHTHNDITDWDTAFSSSFATKTTDDLTEGTTNLYFTNERAQDAVGNILTNTNSIHFNYDDTNNQITADLQIQNSNTINLSIDSNGLKADLITFNNFTEVQPANNDYLLISDASDSYNFKRISINSLKSDVPSTLNTDSTLTSSGVYFVDTSSGNVTITLPTSNSSTTGYKITIKNLGTNQVIIQCQGTDKIDGASTYSLVSQYESVTIYDNLDGNFYIV